MAKRKASLRDEQVENEGERTALREKIIKLYFTAGELRQIRLAAVMTDERPASFIRSAALAKAEVILRESGLNKRLRDD